MESRGGWLRGDRKERIRSVTSESCDTARWSRLLGVLVALPRDEIGALEIPAPPDLAGIAHDVDFPLHGRGPVGDLSHDSIHPWHVTWQGFGIRW
jgi:hypothetical protein